MNLVVEDHSGADVLVAVYWDDIDFIYKPINTRICVHHYPSRVELNAMSLLFESK